MGEDLIRVVTGPTKQAMKDMDRRVQRASMWALREAGRKVKKTARAKAPVYDGDRADVEKGRLKKSISSARRLRKEGDRWVLTVGPRGWRTILYAGKVERIRPYMHPAWEEAAPALEEAAVRGWKRAMEKK